MIMAGIILAAVAAVLELRLETNLAGHPSIAAAYWRNAAVRVRQLLPAADILVYRRNDVIAGFIGIADQKYLDCLIVHLRNR